MMKLRVCLTFVILLMAGCASVPRGPGCVAIGPAGAACLLPPSALPALEARHLVTVEHDGRKDTFLGRLRIDDKALRLVGSSLFGTPVFSLVWDGHAVVMQPQREQMHPGLIVAMLQAAIVDPNQLRPRLYGLVLKVRSDGAGGQIRELYEHGHLVARIREKGTPLARAHLSIAIPSAHMHLTMQPLDSP